MNISDYVLVKQQKHNTFTPNSDPKPLWVKKEKGTMLTTERPELVIARNQSFFKPIKPNKVQYKDKEMECMDQQQEQDNKQENNEVNGENNHHNRGRTKIFKKSTELL